MTTSPAPAMLETLVPTPRAWHGPTLGREHYLLPIPAPVLAEMEAALAELRRAPVPTLLLLPAAGAGRRHEHRVERGGGPQPLPDRGARPAAPALRRLLPRSPGVPGRRRGRDQLPSRLRLGQRPAHALQRAAHRAGLREDRA